MNNFLIAILFSLFFFLNFSCAKLPESALILSEQAINIEGCVDSNNENIQTFKTLSRDTKILVVETLDGFLQAFNAFSGKKLWSVDTGGPLLVSHQEDFFQSYSIIPTLDGDLYISSPDTNDLFSLNINIHSFVDKPFIKIKDTLAFGSKVRYLHKINLITGEVIYSSSNFSKSSSSVFVDDGNMHHILVGRSESHITFLDQTTNTEQWRISLGDINFLKHSDDHEPLKSTGDFSATFMNGFLSIQNPKTSKIIFSDSFSSRVLGVFLFDTNTKLMETISLRHLDQNQIVMIGDSSQQFISDQIGEQKFFLSTERHNSLIGSSHLTDVALIPSKPPSYCPPFEIISGLLELPSQTSSSADQIKNSNQSRKDPKIVEIMDQRVSSQNNSHPKQSSLGDLIFQGWTDIIIIQILILIALCILYMKYAVTVELKSSPSTQSTFATQEIVVSDLSNLSQNKITLPDSSSEGQDLKESSDYLNHDISLTASAPSLFTLAQENDVRRLSSSPTSLAPIMRSRYEEDFEEIEKLGRGGFGSVWKARNKLDSIEYAIKKVPLPEDSTESSTDQKNRILREVKILARLDHHNIVRYYNSWTEQTFIDSEGVEMNDSLDWLVEQSESTDISIKPTKKKKKKGIKSCISKESSSTSQSSHGWGESLGFEFEWSNSPLTQGEEDEESLSMDETEEEGEGDEEEDDNWVNVGEELSKNEQSSDGILFFENSRENQKQKNSSRSISSKSSTENTLTQSTESKIREVLYIQMQLCSKKTLGDWLNQKERNVSITANNSFFIQIIRGIVHIHSLCLIHRDLKPLNIFIAVDGTIKIGDFGLSIVVCPDDLDSTCRKCSTNCSCTTSHIRKHTSGIGTPLYSAPELSTKRSYNEKVDIFSLGIIYYEMCHVFSTQMERIRSLNELRSGDTTDHIKQSYPHQAKMCLEMTNPDPFKRPSASELLTMIESI